MTIKYTYDPKQHAVLTRIIGEVKFIDVLAYLDDLISDSTLTNSFIEVVDLSKAKDFDFGYQQTRQMIDKLVYLASFDKYKGTIFIADTDFTRGMSNMFKMVGEVNSVNVSIVRSIEEALNEVNGRFKVVGQTGDQGNINNFV